jgi:tryptophan-rich sensory protein
MDPLARKFLMLGVSILLVSVVAGAGSLFIPGAWYGQLIRPPGNPPSWVFAPVWTILYLSMAVAAWLVWLRRDHPLARAALGAYLVQLLLNGAWSPVFFGLHAIGTAAILVGVLLVAILVTVILFMKVRRVAGLLLIPYLLWCSFAMYLNVALWVLNR